jgi:hypothetical protein
MAPYPVLPQQQVQVRTPAKGPSTGSSSRAWTTSDPFRRVPVRPSSLFPVALDPRALSLRGLSPAVPLVFCAFRGSLLLVFVAMISILSLLVLPVVLRLEICLRLPR